MVDRLSQIIKSKHLSASQFADDIGVQRSSVSHVLSGRNKPSLDFITKVILRYADINSEWLLTGRGIMTSGEDDESSSFDVTESSRHNSDINADSPIEDVREIIEEQITEQPLKTKAGRGKTTTGSGSVEKIIFFYKDGSFSEYSPNK